MGPIVLRSSMAKFARVFGTLQAGGVSILEILNVTAKVVDNVVISGIIRGLKDSVQEGTGLAVPLKRSGLIPPLVIQMISAGEDSGSLDEMSGKVADFYEADVDDAVDNLSSLLEPLIMAILGVLVGGLVVAMYLPIFKLGAVV